MMNPNQQQPSMFGFVDIAEASINPVFKFILAAIGAVGGYWYGLDHASIPLVLFVILGLLGGLLAIVIVKHLTIFAICAALMIVAAGGTYLLLSREHSIRRAHGAATSQTLQEARPDQTPGLLDDLLKAVR